MKKYLAAFLALSLACSITLSAQERFELRRVSLEELVSFMDRNFPERFFCVVDEAEQSTFTVVATRDKFLEEAYAALKEKGYVISSYGDSRFILHGKSVYTGLPAGYFDDGSSTVNNEDLQKYLAEQSAVVSFQNKVYEIGEPGSGRKGKVFVSGHVRDVSSGEPLVGVSVYDEKTGAYTVTDGSGFYRIALPVGDVKLNLSGYSLEDMHLSLKLWDDGALNVVMKEKVMSLKGAVVSADAVSRHRDAKMGVERVRMDVINKIPTAFGEGDIIKAVLTLPGVKSVGEASSGFNVRGGSTDQNLIQFNDGTIYNPTHLFGIFSAFNPDIVSEVELYKSSIPVEFGGRISSVLDVRSREGNSKKLAGSLGIGLLTSRLHLEGPIVKDKTTFILGGRTTYSNWLLNLLPKGNEYSGAKASFSDVNASLTHHFSDRNSIQGCFYWSRDDFSFARDPAFKYSNINGSLKWRSSLSSRHSMTAVAGYDNYNARLEDSLGENQASGYAVDNHIRQVYAKLIFKLNLTDKHNITYGAQGTYYMLNPGDLSPLYPDKTLVISKSLPMQTGVEPAIYVSDSWNPATWFTLDGGIRVSGIYLPGYGKFYWNPEYRVSSKVSFADNFSLKAGFNTMSQYIHLISNTSSISPIDTWQLCDDKIRPQNGWQAAGGLYWTIGGSVDLSVEGYYKHTEHQLDYKNGASLMMNENLPDYLVETYGKAYGVEFMARKTSGKLTGWISYTWSRSFLREMEDRGVQTINGGAWYNAPHDKPHDLKIVSNYKFTHRYSLSANLEYASGRPVTMPIGYFMYGNGYRLAYSERNAYRIPDYFRLDLALNIDAGHYLKQFSHMSWTIGVYNVTARKNAYSVFYQGMDSYILSVFAYPVPYVNLNLKF